MNYLQPHEQRPKGIKDLNPNALMAMTWILIGIYIIVQIGIGYLN